MPIRNEAKHWRHRADEMRRLARDVVDHEAKQTMLRIAGEYERLAEHAESRTWSPQG